MPRRSKQEAISDPPPKVHTCYLVPLISLWILNRFSRFQWCCDPFERPFQRCIIQPDTPRGFHVRVCKQKRGKFRISSPRACIETGVPPLWLPELGGFSGIGTTRFGVILKFCPTSFHIRFCMLDASVSTIIGRSGAQWASTSADPNAFFRFWNALASSTPKCQVVDFLQWFRGRVVSK